ncbi:hypothetical protein BCR34DRAFT_228316 [Clohesyomyces aquaticus]|uniref:Uncharacterized protein n=1 Tax=Clohesyomyces aquaticus TaxID=1231657 RepID=A0A1Y1ZWK7_9PLEO|nr:hypothetical protein BCR34DRAFT_228316 [Clohesyomyces aquaticus]
MKPRYLLYFSVLATVPQAVLSGPWRFPDANTTFPGPSIFGSADAFKNDHPPVPWARVSDNKCIISYCYGDKPARQSLDKTSRARLVCGRMRSVREVRRMVLP